MNAVNTSGAVNLMLYNRTDERLAILRNYNGQVRNNIKDFNTSVRSLKLASLCDRTNSNSNISTLKINCDIKAILLSVEC